MGLGPLICVECELFAQEDPTRFVDHYRCPRCGSGVLEYLWMFDDEQQKRVVANSKFYRFTQGQDR